jgi:putative ABC transport system permease protein
MEGLLQDFRFGLRMLGKAPAFVVVAVATLALGIGTSTVGFSVFYNLLFNAFAAKDPTRLAVPIVRDSDSTRDVQPLRCSVSDLEFVRQQNEFFEDVVGYDPIDIVLFHDGPRTFQFHDSRVTADAFEFYGVPALIGRGIEPYDGKPGAPPVFVMGYKTWKDDFNADLNIVGKRYVVDGEVRTLVGVMPERFQGYGSLSQIWIPITWTHGASVISQRHPAVDLLGRLKPGATLQAASSNFDVIATHLAALYPNRFPKHFTVQVESAEDFLMGPQGGGPFFFSDMKHLMYDLLVAVMILLLIACSNAANLILARATAREKEIKVRAALGATRARLVRQLLTESSLLAIAACVAGCLFAWLGMKFVAVIQPLVGAASFQGSLGGEITVGFNVPVLAFAIVVTMFTTLICGLAPALHVSCAEMTPRSAAGNGGTTSRGKLRAILVVTEIALSIVLLTGAGLMIRTLFLLTHVDLGFSPKNVLMMAFIPPPTQSKVLPAQWFHSTDGQATLERIVDRLKTLPGVANVSVEDTIPGYGPGRGPEVAAPSNGRMEEAGLLSCDQNFFQTINLRLLKGRWISREEVQTAQRVVVVDQRLAHDFFGDENPVGQQLEVKKFEGVSIPSRDTYFQIVGVVADIKSMGPQRPAMPIAFVPVTVRGGNFLLVRTNVDPMSLKRAAQEQVWAVDPDLIFVVSDPLTTFLQKFTYATPEFGVTMFAPLASIALLLVIAGVFSVMAYTVSLQTHEIGIRMALGAQQRNILRMVLLSGIRLVAIGIFAGVLVSLELTKFIASQIWGISATDPATFAGVAIVLVIVALTACWIPARRAMRVDPMVALRYE